MNHSTLIRRIEGDPNLPVSVRDQATCLLRQVQTWNEVHSALLTSSARSLLLRGPECALSSHTKLTRVVSLWSFIKYWLTLPLAQGTLPKVRHSLRTDPNSIIHHIRWPSRSTIAKIAWVTSSEEVVELSADSIISGLGLRYIPPGTDLVLITYGAANIMLRVPTVLDALLDPVFVAKPRATQEPRAWNWDERKWGLTEFVHVDDEQTELIGFHLTGGVQRASVLYDSAYLEKETGEQIIDIARPQIVNMNDRLVRRLSSNPHLMYEISSREFEEVIAELLSDMGWTVELTQPTRDGGFDALALWETNLGPILCLVEAKRYRRDHPLGVELVRTLYGTMSDKRASTSLLVTTSSFTAGAREFQGRNKYQINLRDHSDISNWLREYSRRRCW